MGATSSVFVGRQAELDVVSSALDASRASRPQIVSIEGEAGIGKSAFLHRVLPSGDDVVVLEASGDENEIALEYGVVSQLASRAALVSSSASLTDRIEQQSPASAFSVGAELLAMLGSLVERGPLVVVLDDAHLMDLPSAGAVLFALRRLYADRVLVLIASRPNGLDRLGPSWMRLLNDSERTRRVRLSGLTARDVGQLADSRGFGPLPLAAAERLREHTGGHPLYVWTLLGELPPEALFVDDGPLPAPHSFAATVLARLAKVHPDTRELVAAAAVVGKRCPLALAVEVAEVSDPFAALDEALAAELLTLVPARIPEEVTFPHPLVHAAVYDDLSPSRRRELHLACAALTSGPASLPHRIAASPGADDALGRELTADGEEQVARGALTPAADQMLWAWRIAASRGLAEAALLRAVQCLVLAGELPRALALRDAVLACSDSPRRSSALCLLTASVGRLAEAEVELRELMARPDLQDDPDLFGEVTGSLAVVYAYLRRGDEAVALARSALEANGSAATTRVLALQALGMGLLIQGRAREGIAVFDSLSAVRMRPEPFEADLLTSRGNLKAWWGDLVGAVEDLSAVIRWSRDGAPLRNLPNAYGALAEVEYRLGLWDEGLTHAEVAVSLAEDTDRVWDLPFVHAVASYFHAGRGNWRLASGHADAARRLTAVAPLPVSRYYAEVAAAQLAWARGDYAGVLGALPPTHGRSREIVASGLGQNVPLLLEVDAMIGLGRLDEAARVLRGVEDSADESPSDIVRVDLSRLRGALEHARGHPAKARKAFEEGRTVAKAAGPLAQATLELAYGHFLHKTGNRRTAIASLRSARELFERLDARPFLERCDVELTACGVRSGSNGSRDDHGLTAREQVVANLVASGKSNREVAAELYLSTKAVEYHLGNIFTKVGIHSRHELASRIARAGVAS